jgi:hypothetical protein
MSRINPNDLEKYQSPSNSSEFFSLKNDKDTAVVHFLAETTDDLDIFVVHKVKEGEKYRYVSCLRNAGEPVDNCPLCAAGLKPEVRIFAQMYDAKDKKVKIWDRGRTFLKLLEPFARRIKPLFKRPFEIERNGVAGDMKTTYGLFALEPDNNYPEMTLEQLPEKVQVSGREKTIILERTAEELKSFLKTGKLTSTGGTEQATPRENKQDKPSDVPQPGRRRVY